MKASAATGILLALLAFSAGCGWLSPATAPNPAQIALARPINQIEPESTLANVQEAFRVGSQTTYMLSIADSISPANSDRFTLIFDFGDRNGATNPQDPLLNGGWHADQERNAISSIMNSIPNATDTSAFWYEIGDSNDEPPDEKLYSVTYHLRITQGGTKVYEGTALLTFKRLTSGTWVILRWEDHRLNVPAPPPTFGMLRYNNRS